MDRGRQRQRRILWVSLTSKLLGLSVAVCLLKLQLSSRDVRVPQPQPRTWHGKFPVKTLSAAFPWPASPPFKPFEYALDGGGREILYDLLQRHQDVPLVFLEIGPFLGGSMQQWMKHHKMLRGVVLELGSTATNGKSIAQYIRRMERDGEDPKLRKTSGREGVMRSLDNLLEDYGDRKTLLSNLWPFRDRLVVTFDGAPHGMFRIHAMGFVPDIVYVDTDKYYDELWVAAALWPHAILTGDDFKWRKKVGDSGCVLTAKDGIARFARKTNRTILARKHTFVLSHPNSKVTLH